MTTLVTINNLQLDKKQPEKPSSGTASFLPTTKDADVTLFI